MQPSRALLLAILGCCLALTLAQQQHRGGGNLLSRTDERDGRGQYNQGYQTDDRQQVQENGYLKRTNDGQDYVVAKQGSYSYVSPEGNPVQVKYTADEYGFHVYEDLSTSRPRQIPVARTA